jgi:hypothetical protein
MRFLTGLYHYVSFILPTSLHIHKAITGSFRPSPQQKRANRTHSEEHQKEKRNKIVGTYLTLSCGRAGMTLRLMGRSCTAVLRSWRRVDCGMWRVTSRCGEDGGQWKAVTRWRRADGREWMAANVWRQVDGSVTMPATRWWRVYGGERMAASGWRRMYGGKWMAA